MSEINSQALREAAEQAMHDDWGFDADLFHELVTPSIVLELLDERERNQQYIKRRDQENEDIALTVGNCVLSLKQQNQNSTSSVSITKVLSRMGVSVLLNWKATKSVKTETSFLLFAILGRLLLSSTALVTWKSFCGS